MCIFNQVQSIKFSRNGYQKTTLIGGLFVCGKKFTNLDKKLKLSISFLQMRKTIKGKIVMHNKSIYVVIGLVLAMVVSSLVLVFTVGPKVDAAGKYATMYVGEESDFKIDENGVLTGLSDAAWTRYNQYTGYVAVSINVTIPDTVKEIADAALASSVIEKISIPNGVTRIGKRAFAGSLIESVTIPSTIEYIGENAFSCLFIKSITIINGVTEISDKAFAGCGDLNYVYIPNSVKRIGNEAFADSPSSLKYISLPEGLESIGDRAFACCQGLERINLPKTVTDIGEDIFQDCANLTQITVENEDLLSNDNFAQYVAAGILHPAKVTVFFDTDGGTEVNQQSVNYGYYAQKPSDPTREGYRFLGWYLGDSEYYFNSRVTESITLTAKWEEIRATESSSDGDGVNIGALIAGITGGSATGLGVIGTLIGVVINKKRRNK